MKRQAVCLLSGGLDSATALYVARSEGFRLTALTFHYGQKHSQEIDCAQQLALALNIPHFVLPIQLPWKGTSLIDPAIPIPTDRSEEQMQAGIPSTYVPARNSIFLALAASCAEAEGAEAIFIGANALDYSGYPDCRPEYFETFQEMIRLGTKAGIEGRKMEIQAPLLRLSKKEIILLGVQLGVPFEKTWSCYRGQEMPCGKCDSCLLRAKGFREAGFQDPLLHHVASSLR